MIWIAALVWVGVGVVAALLLTRDAWRVKTARVEDPWMKRRERAYVLVLCIVAVVAVGLVYYTSRPQVFEVCNFFPPDYSPAEIVEAREAGMLTKDPCGDYYIESELLTARERRALWPSRRP